MAAPSVPRPVTAASRPRLPLRVRATYGLGDLASQFVWTITASYLAVFYTDTVGIAAGTVAVLLLLARALDGLFDLLIGAVAERTRSRFGRFRPWILYGMLPLAVLLVLTFTAPFPGDSTAAVVWAAITYGLLGLLFSVVNVPYGALSTVMADTTADRVSLNSFRMINANLGNVLLAALTVPLIVLFSGVGDGRTLSLGGYTLTALLLAVVSLPIFFAVFATSREVVVPVRSERVPFATTARVVLTSLPLLLVFAITLLALTSFFGRLGVVLYYYLYNVQNFALIPLLMSVPSLAAIFGIATFTRFARRIGKRNLLAVSLVVQAAALVALYLVGYDDIVAVLALSFVYGLATFGTPLVISMIPDCIDHAEDRTGVRADGTSYAVVTLSTKVASAIGGAAGIGMLGLVGYVPNARQSLEAMGGINAVVNLGPAALALLALVPLAFYRLGEGHVAEIRNRLDAQLASNSSSDDG